MKGPLRWIGILSGVVVALVIVAGALVYVLSERALSRTYAAPAASVSIPTDPGAIAEGRRLTAIRGCFTDCHGKHGEGRVMFDQPAIARVVAPNLTSAVRRYTDAQLATIIRHGVRPDGRSVLVMPSEAYVTLTDVDLGSMIAYLKSLPSVAGPGPSISVGPLGRLGLISGKFKTAARLIAEGTPPPEATSEVGSLGRYLARTTCGPCHGSDLRGASNPDFTSPSLRVVVAYSPEGFSTLLRTGTALGERRLPVMSPQAVNLTNLTDAEISALYSYLHALPDAASR